MLKEGSRITVHIYDCSCREIATRNFGKVFEVKKQNGKLGIDWNEEKDPPGNKENIFSPFRNFSPTVRFEDVDSGKRYYFSPIVNTLVEADMSPVESEV